MNAVPPARCSMAGDGLLHPVALSTMAILVLNDHLWKSQWPGTVTGKLSDIAGLVLFPLLLQAAVEVWNAVRGRGHRPSRRVLIVCILLTGSVFAAAELSSTVDSMLQVTWGWLRWPLTVVGGDSMRPGVLTQDATDMITLPALLIAWEIGRRRHPTMRTAGEAVSMKPSVAPRTS